MEIYVLNGLSGISNVIDTFRSVIWNVQFFSFNDFELVVSGTKTNIAKLPVGALLVRDSDISSSTFKNVMIIESRELTYDIEEGWILTVRGGGLKRLLRRRIVWQQTNLTGTVEAGIRQVITENVISPSDSNRQISNFTLATAQGYTETFEAQLLGENIGEWLESTCQIYGMGWDVYIENGNYVFTLMKGTDRTYDQSDVIPVVFSPEFDNLISSTYTYDVEEYTNAALVGGEGEGTSQRLASVGSATGLDRYETYVDGTSVSSNGEIITAATYLKMLENYGQEQIAGSEFVEKFEGNIIPNGMYELNEDYFLGDLVQIENENGISAVTRIIEIIYSEDENGWSLVPTFSSWEGDD